MYPQLSAINSQVVEQANSALKRIKSSLSYMNQEFYAPLQILSVVEQRKIMAIRLANMCVMYIINIHLILQLVLVFDISLVLPTWILQ